MTKKAIAKRKITRDCFDLDQAWLKWLSERLPVYLRDARKMIDFSFHKFTHRGKECQQDELVERMIVLVNKAMAIDFGEPEYDEVIDELMEIWKLIFHAMWW